MQSLSDPARQAMLSRVTHLDVQRAVTIMTIATSSVGILGFLLGGQLEHWGVATVLLVQSALFALGLFAVALLPPLPPIGAPSAPGALASLAAGLRATAAVPLVRNMISLNFLSSLFNAGAYIVVVPYILSEVYGGGAGALAQAMIVFTLGSIASNLLLLRYMPLLHPGRLWLLMQLTRMVILGLIYLEPAPLLFDLLLVAWGVNMGVTTTLVRTTVQELAPPAQRAGVLSILLFSFMVSSPVSALLLGIVISSSSPTVALLPGIAVSAVIFALGAGLSGLWQYRSAAADRSPAPPGPDPASE
ncbi:MAG: MFS transporter [Pseudomonadota bacterium]